jgi:hypothetical protein
MRCLRNPCTMTASIVSAVGVVAVVGFVADGTLAIPAVGVLDAVVIGISSVCSALVAVAGILLAADMRADRDGAHAWQSFGDPVRWTIEQSVDANTTHGSHHAYAAGPQDERLRAILRAHRLAMPLVATGEAKANTSACVDNSATITRASTNADPTNSIAGSTIDQDYSVRQIAKTEHAEIRPELVLIATTDKVEKCGVDTTIGLMRREYRPVRSASKLRRVANVEQWWSAQVVGAELWPRTVPFRHAADVIVLADRGGRNHSPNLPDHSIDATAQAQPACRGPPCHANAGRSSSTQGTFGRRLRPKVDAATESDALIVVDNLGETVPVGAAELSVIETFLDGVLRDVLSTVDSSQDDSTT